MSLADIKANARQALHNFMARPASFYDSSGALLPEHITARRHDAPKVVGDLAGTNLSYAETHERPTTVVLWKSQLSAVNLRRGCLIIFASDEGWYVESVKPADNQTITVEVTEMKVTALSGKTLPDGTTVPV